MRDYDIDIALEAARNGFGEIQFDYMRLPDATGLNCCVANDEQYRVRAISEFFKEVRKRLLHSFIMLQRWCWS